MINLIDFLNNKQIIINKKIKKTKLEIIKLKQLGGGPQEKLNKLQEEIIKLVIYNETLSKRKDQLTNLDLEKIIENLTTKTNQITKFINDSNNSNGNELTDINKTNKIKKLIKDIENQLIVDNDDYLNFKLNNKLKFVIPSEGLNISKIDEMNNEFNKNIQDSILKIELLLGNINKVNKDTDSLDESKKGLLNNSIIMIDEKNKELSEYNNKITENINLINENTEFTSFSSIDSNHFVKPDDVDMIPFNKSDKDVDITKISERLNELSVNNTDKNLNSVESLTRIPVYNMDITQSGGFNNKKNKEFKITNKLVKKWDNELIKNKNKLYKKYYKNKLYKKQSNKNLENKQIILKGGSWNNYFDELITIEQKLFIYKNIYNTLIENAKKFNLLYIQFYYHKLFIINYVKLIFSKKDYRIYQNISRGTVSYYHSNVKYILEKITNPEIINNDNVYKYFYYYHYITLKYLDKFLFNLYNNWKGVAGADGADGNINSSRLLILNINHPAEIKKGFFLLNLFKDILDSFYLSQRPPVSVYLRINDDPTKHISTITFQKSEDDKGKLDIDSLKSCIVCNDKQCKTILEPFNNKIIFNEIYDPKGFESNDVLALYMGLPNFLSKKRSIMMMTYGYSGVGKTYTLFGDENNQGILQKTLSSIQGSTAIYTRTYEIYGLALPYKAYWSRHQDYKHSIIVYNLDGEKIQYREIKDNTEIEKYLNEISLTNINNSSYNLINDEDIKNFSIFVEDIDEIRTNEGRIKKTINNDKSSRSIMVYEFKVILNNDIVNFVVMDLPGKEDILKSYVEPGENIPETEADYLSKFCIKLKQNIIDYGYNVRALRSAIYLNPILLATFPEIAKLLNDFMFEKYKDNQNYLNFPVTTIKQTDLDVKVLNSNKTMKNVLLWANYKVTENFDINLIKTKLITYIMDKTMFNYNKKNISAYEITKNESINIKGISGVSQNNIIKKLLKDLINYKEFNTEINKLQNLSNDELKKFLNNKLTNEELKIIYYYLDKTPEPDINFIQTNYTDKKNEKNYKECILASENLRYLLENNMIEDLILFYNDKLIDNNNNCENYSSISFEGFYINENILGLINALSSRLNNTNELPIESMDNFFSEYLSKIHDEQRQINSAIIGENTIKFTKPQSVYKITENEKLKKHNEIRSQTYFLRDFLRNEEIINNNMNNIKFFNEDNILKNKVKYTNYTYKDKTIKEWFEGSYNFNKTYADISPISQFMKAYFVKNDNEINNVIDNFYLFYVVSNLKNCKEQIKLISDSEKFINTINNYNP